MCTQHLRPEYMSATDMPTAKGSDLPSQNVRSIDVRAGDLLPIVLASHSTGNLQGAGFLLESGFLFSWRGLALDPLLPFWYKAAFR
jgi:hypothetical protein